MLICKVKNISDYIYRYKTLIENFGYLTLLQICNLLIPLVTYPYLINTLGKNLYGVIIYSQAIVSYLAIFVNWGFNISATKYISINREDSKKINEIVSVVYIVKTLLLVLEHTISVFDNHPLIDEIAIVVHPNYLEKVEELCCINNFKKVGRILQGGSERYYSSLSAINAYASTENDINLIFHDSVRPLVTKRIISDCITMLGKYGAVDVAIPATDTIIKMNLNTHEIEDIPNRQFLYNGQTPQAFKLSVIREAYKRALVDPNFKTTDDCGVVLKYMPDIPIGVVPGEKFNMKLTHKEDLFLLDKLFQLKSVSDVSLYGQETALEHKVIVIFGGSYGIGHSIAELCTGLKAKVYSFSRSETGTDVADASLVKEALEKVYLIEKKIDFVINTAGILLKIPLMTMKYDDILNLIRVNYLGAINVAKESFSYLAKSHGGLLLFTSSSYTRGRAMYSLYSSSKAAIVNLVQALSEEWKSYNIKINCINPERTKTPMRIQNFGIEPENSLLSPQFVAETSIMTLLSGLTGQVIDVRRKTD